MPYRVDLPGSADAALDRLIELGALDVEISHAGVAALMPDAVTPEQIRQALGVGTFTIAPAVARDAGSVWVLSPRPITIGRVHIVPAGMEAEPGAIRLIDAPAFGTGLHPTTALCLEAIGELLASTRPDAILDVGTGSGVLALAALSLGVPHATGVDTDDEALRAASANARLNALDRRLHLARGGPDAVRGQWPLVVANVLAAALIEMAPSLVTRLGHHGRLVLSGIPRSVERDVQEAYRRLGLHRVEAASRHGWVALTLQASW